MKYLPSSRPFIVGQPVNILFVIDQLCEIGGAERMLLNMIRLLPTERFQSRIMTFKIATDLELFRNLPCPHVVYPIRSTYDLNALRTIFSIRRFLDAERIQIVHTFHETSDLWAGPISKIGSRRILVSSRRDMGILRSSKHDLGYRCMNSLFDLVLTVSEEVRQFCIERDRISPRKVVTLYNGIELGKFPPIKREEGLRSTLGIPTHAPLIVTVGNVRPVKGIDILIEAAAKVVQQNPEAVFLVLGRISDGEYFRQLQTMVQRLGVREKVRFVSESAQILSTLRASNVFCLPSRSEGFSNALIEAMACELPCVATRVGGNAEAIEDGQSGYVVESEDSDAIADRILKLLRDPSMARTMGKTGRKIVEAKFTSEIMMRKLVALYEHLLQESRN